MRKFIALILLCAFVFADQKVVILVEEMHCPLCTAMVRKALLKLDGVKEVKASLRDKTAVVKTLKDISEQQLLDAVATTGYKGKIINNLKE